VTGYAIHNTVITLKSRYDLTCVESNIKTQQGEIGECRLTQIEFFMATECSAGG